MHARVECLGWYGGQRDVTCLLGVCVCAARWWLVAFDVVAPLLVCRPVRL